MLGGNEAEARALHAHVDRLREQRAELAPPGQSVEVVAEKIEQRAERKVAAVREREAQELSWLDKLIAAAREMAVEVKERATELARHASERVKSFLGRAQEAEHENQAQKSPASLSVEKASSLPLSASEELARQLEKFRAAGKQGQIERNRKLEAIKPKLVIEPQQEQQRSLQKEQQIEVKEPSHGYSL